MNSIAHICNDFYTVDMEDVNDMIKEMKVRDIIMKVMFFDISLVRMIYIRVLQDRLLSRMNRERTSLYEQTIIALENINVFYRINESDDNLKKVIFHTNNFKMLVYNTHNGNYVQALKNIKILLTYY